MITEATGIPDSSAPAPASEPATPPPATAQEPSQETVLSELRTARKEGKEPDFSAPAPKTEPAKAEPPKDPAQNSNEQKLKDKHGENYKPSQDRQKHRAQIEDKIKRLTELESKWKGVDPSADSNNEFTEDNFEYKTLTKELEKNISDYKAEIKSELESKYSSDETFKAQHDHYGDMVFSELEGAGEFTNTMLAHQNGFALLQKLYTWLDMPGHLEIWTGATPEQRMSALKVEMNNMRYAPRVPVAPATTTPAPAATPAAGPALPTIPMTVKPNPAGTGGGAGLDLNKQEDCLKFVRQKRKEMM